MTTSETLQCAIQRVHFQGLEILDRIDYEPKEETPQDAEVVKVPIMAPEMTESPEVPVIVVEKSQGPHDLGRMILVGLNNDLALAIQGLVPEDPGMEEIVLRVHDDGMEGARKAEERIALLQALSTYAESSRPKKEVLRPRSLLDSPEPWWLRFGRNLIRSMRWRP